MARVVLEGDHRGRSLRSAIPSHRVTARVEGVVAVEEADVACPGAAKGFVAGHRRRAPTVLALDHRDRCALLSGQDGPDLVSGHVVRHHRHAALPPGGLLGSHEAQRRTRRVRWDMMWSGRE
ncbi:hypothetical protein QJS66_09790 [Kocuria rhizophila]|nr:hypothetical protein QJS66_09790 [Kocuria rhizophila]